MTDHQRGDTVLPEHPVKTPNLERLASEGLTFTNAFCPTAHCCPSRATFHTGLYPSRHGVWNNVCNGQAISRGLRRGVRLWSEDLADAGYSLDFCGKWHVSSEESPKDRGWNEHFVSGTAAEHHGKRWDDFKSLAAVPEQAVRGEGEILRPGYSTYTLYRTLESVNSSSHDEKVVAESLSVLDNLSKSSNPWCLFAGLIGPHDPYCVPKKYLDDMFGKIMRKLDDSGRRDDTLVLYVSDHGDYCGDHGLFAKGVPSFRGAYNVPAVIRWPNGIKSSGRRIGKFVSLADFAPFGPAEAFREASHET